MCVKQHEEEHGQVMNIVSLKLNADENNVFLVKKRTHHCVSDCAKPIRTVFESFMSSIDVCIVNIKWVS
jgi:hypothetical protein